MCNFLSSVSSQQKFEAIYQRYSPCMDQHYSSWTDQCHSSVSQLSFIQKTKKNTSSRSEGMTTQKTPREERGRKRETPQCFGSSFYMFFLLPLGLPCVNWTSQERCLFYPRFSLQSSNLPLFYFSQAFPLLVF